MAPRVSEARVRSDFPYLPLSRLVPGRSESGRLYKAAAAGSISEARWIPPTLGLAIRDKPSAVGVPVSRLSRRFAVPAGDSEHEDSEEADSGVRPWRRGPPDLAEDHWGARPPALSVPRGSANSGKRRRMPGSARRILNTSDEAT